MPAMSAWLFPHEAIILSTNSPNPQGNIIPIVTGLFVWCCEQTIIKIFWYKKQENKWRNEQTTFFFFLKQDYIS